LNPAALSDQRAEYERVLTKVTDPLKDTYLDALEAVEVAVSAQATAASPTRTTMVPIVVRRSSMPRTAAGVSRVGVRSRLVAEVTGVPLV
jgi:cytochrome b involved in lipid metabolism